MTRVRRRRHMAREEGKEDGGEEGTVPRVTFLVNVWLNHCPIGIEECPILSVLNRAPLPAPGPVSVSWCKGAPVQLSQQEGRHGGDDGGGGGSGALPWLLRTRDGEPQMLCSNDHGGSQTGKGVPRRGNNNRIVFQATGNICERLFHQRKRLSQGGGVAAKSRQIGCDVVFVRIRLVEARVAGAEVERRVEPSRSGDSTGQCELE